MLFNPFNFNPLSVAVKTAAYPIPAGRYAIVTAQVNDGGSFTIAGATALKSIAGTKTAVNVDQEDYTVPADKWFEGLVAPSGTSINAVVGGINIPSPTQVTLGPGQFVDNDSAGGGPTVAVVGILHSVDPESNSETAIFYVPSGVTISGAGDWRASVAEYLIPT